MKRLFTKLCDYCFEEINGFIFKSMTHGKSNFCSMECQEMFVKGLEIDKKYGKEYRTNIMSGIPNK